MEQILYLEIDDDILTIRDRLRRAQSKKVLLVVPPGCQGLRRELDVKLLRRQAAALELGLAVVTDNPRLCDLALDQGLMVLPRLALGRRLRQGPRWQVADRPGLDGLVARFRAQRPRWWHWVVGPVVIALVLTVLAASVIAVWPSATVEITPAREPVGVSIVVEAHPSTRAIDRERLRLPVRVVQIEVVDRGQVETTGVTNVGADPAVGTVLLVNLTRRELSVSMDTIVSTSAGTPVRFRTTEPVVIPARGRASVRIEALEPGPGGNVRAHLINRLEGELSANLRVTNERATTGGTNTQVRRVTHGDKQRVSDVMIGRLLQKGHAELSALLEDEFVPLESMWINGASIRTNYDHHVDDVSDTLALEMRAVVGGLAVSEDGAEQLAMEALNRQVREGFHLLDDSVHVARGDLVGVDEETGAIRFVVDAVGLMQADIDSRLVLQAIKGRQIGDAVAYLRSALPIETVPVVAVDPVWMKRMPWMPFRIAVVEREPVVGMTGALPGS